LFRLGRLLAGVASLAATDLTAEAGSPPDNVAFLGVAAGDASSQDAILWTRAVDTNAPAVVVLTAQVSTNPAFGSFATFAVNTDTTKDYTAKVVATGLAASTRYYYRFTDGTNFSIVGTFKTVPATNAAVPVHFAFSGDMDGL